MKKKSSRRTFIDSNLEKVWISLHTTHCVSIAATVRPWVIHAKSIHIVTSDIVVHLLFHSLLALNAFSYHLVVFFHGHWLSHLYHISKTGWNTAIWMNLRSNVWYLLFRTLFLLCLRSCLLEVHMKRLLFSLGSEAPDDDPSLPIISYCSCLECFVCLRLPVPDASTK